MSAEIKMDFDKIYGADMVGKCPHCNRDTRFVSANMPSGEFDGPGRRPYNTFHGQSILAKVQLVQISASQCFLCEGLIVWLQGGDRNQDPRTSMRIWPMGKERSVPALVPTAVAQVYRRSSRLLDFDNGACAAFARTCLEKLLDDQKVKKGPNLETRITTFLESHHLPGELHLNVDKLRQMGNFIHLNESFVTGDVLEISPEEAEWALDILAELFEELYVRPSEQQGRRQAFEAKQIETRRNIAGSSPTPKS